jgi:hypothetical protein
MTLTAEPAAPATPQSLFHNRNFLLLFTGKIISLLGDQIYSFALSWYVLDLTKSSFQMAAFLAINTLAVALVAPFGVTNPAPSFRSLLFPFPTQF